jgi:large repetitive protein
MEMQTSSRSRARVWLRFIATVLLLSIGAQVHAASLSVSTSASRSGAVSLQGATLAASTNVYIFAVNETGLVQVRFYLDRAATGSPNTTEGLAPFDFAATAGSGNANPFNTSALSSGSHFITSVFSYQNGSSQTVMTTFAVGGGSPPPPPPPPPPTYSLQLSPNADRSTPAALNGSTLSANAAYIFLTPTAGVARVDFFLDSAAAPTASESAAPLDFAHTAANNTALPWNPTTVPDGAHSIRAVVTPSSGSAQTVTANFTVSTATSPPPDGNPDDRCAPVICNQIRVTLPFTLEFNGDAGHLLDALGVGTGFTYVLPSSNAPSYTKAKLLVDPSTGRLGITTTPGIFTTNVNTHTNVLGAGFVGQAQVARITTRIVAPPNGSGGFEQAGLWFGYDQDHYFKVVYESAPSGNAIEFYEEFNGLTVKSSSIPVTGTPPSAVSLELVVDPYNQLVSAYYALNSNDLAELAQPVSGAPEFFSFDAAGIDPEIGTRSFTGIFATNRNGKTPLTYWFDNFSITASPGGTPPPGPLTFNKTSYPVSNPTNMVWGPDNRLYVTEMFGYIHALTFDSNLHVVADQVIKSFTNLNGQRLTLGIAVDPASTASDVRLWVSSSSPSASAGLLNSGMVTKLSGPNFATAQNVITGLPRAISNHAPNSMHFGPDGRLYLTIGGNTGTGAPADEDNEFGDRPEQWLSAAMDVADVNAPNFNGACTPATPAAQPTCDVQVYATGMRNSYDFVFHSNGYIYATDNGLGVTGAYPPTPTPPCFGTGSAKPWDQGGDNPGTQSDLLHRVEHGKYYGHPNPARSECVFKDGSYQHVAPLLSYVPPFADLGDHMSADGITEYTGTAVCGTQGSLLIANYSLGQNITKVTLAQDGLSVGTISTLVSGLAGPLGITTNPTGDIFVTELNSNLVTALRYSGPACK